MWLSIIGKSIYLSIFRMMNILSIGYLNNTARKCKHSLTSILLLVFLFCLQSMAQNPLDIKSRLDQNENSEQIDPSAIDQTPEGSSNPFDIKKEPNGHISKPVEPKESKQYVNDESKGLSKQAKLGILLGFIIYFVLARNLNDKGFSDIGKSLRSQVKLIEYKHSFNGFLNTQLALFYLFFFINIAYFFYLCVENKFWPFGDTGFRSFTSIIAVVISIYVVKYISLMLIEYTLDIRRAISNHLFSVSIHNIFLGFSLFLINAFFAFTTKGLSMYFMILGIGLIVLVYAIRQVKGLSFLSDLRQFSMLHFFIYLCSCEISPLIVAVKLITG